MIKDQISAINSYYQKFVGSLTYKQKIWVKHCFITVSIIIATLGIIGALYQKSNDSVLADYAGNSKSSAIKLSKLSNGQATVYPSDIDNVKMISPFDLSSYRQKALNAGYDDNYAGYVSIPSIGMYLPILNGVNMQTLALGAAAYYPDVVKMGGTGNYVLAGHNMNTSLNVLFSRVPNLNPNNHGHIILTDKKKNYYYRIMDKKLVRPYQPVYQGTCTPTKDSILYNNKNKKKITLFTCNYNGTRRWVITGGFDYETRH